MKDKLPSRSFHFDEIRGVFIPHVHALHKIIFRGVTGAAVPFQLRHCGYLGNLLHEKDAKC